MRFEQDIAQPEERALRDPKSKLHELERARERLEIFRATRVLER